MITNEGLGTELAWDIYSKLKLTGKMSHMNLILHECENEIFDLRSYTLVAVLFLLAFREFLGMSRRSRSPLSGGGMPMVWLPADWGRFCSSQQSTAAAAMCVVVAGVRFGLVLLELETRGHTGAAPMGR